MKFFSESAGGGVFALLLAMSAVFHFAAVAWIGWTRPPAAAPSFPAEEPIEIQLVQDMPATPEEPDPVEEQAQEIPEEPPPETPSEPEVTGEEAALEPPPPEPAPLPQPAPPKTAPKPSPKAKPSVEQTQHPRTRAVPSAKPRMVEAKPDASRNPPPHYPESARRAKLEGRVLVRATVGTGGKVVGVSLAKSSGHGVLDRAALDAVRRWRFRPRTVDGVPQTAAVEVPVHFFLQK